MSDKVDNEKKKKARPKLVLASGDQGSLMYKIWASNCMLAITN